MSETQSKNGWGGPRPNSGGKREGAGRPPLPPDQRKITTQVNTRLTPTQLEQLKALGNGNTTQGISKLLENELTSDAAFAQAVFELCQADPGRFPTPREVLTRLASRITDDGNLVGALASLTARFVRGQSVLDDDQ